MENFPMQPPQASEHAEAYDALFMAIAGLTILFTVIVGIMVLFFAIRYRSDKKIDRKNPMSHNIKLEMTWIIIPTILGLGIFVWSTLNFIKVRTMPEDATEIYVIGKQWMWHIQHMNGIREIGELHIPIGKPVKLTMISQDVIHSMYLPAFRTQFHVVPGIYTELAFTPTKTGRYRMLCAMHCGTQHSEMVGWVYVMSEVDYNRWLETDGNSLKPQGETMPEAGARIFKEKGCGNCHTNVDTDRAPTLLALMGRQRSFNNAAPRIADRSYVRESITEPWDIITQGYTNTMPAYRGELTEEQILDLVAYIQSLGRPAPDGEREKFERPGPPSATGSSAPDTVTDIANARKSAGDAQSRRTEDQR
ncbi:MAG: cytochrome c oxidase subunit II [Armatimonadetes bacterium]|nr:cytochrome c oxidase subunit II [Armatimonadota bacterium]